MNHHLKLAELAQQVLSDDGVLDQRELNALVDLALADGRIDPAEEAILSNLFLRLDEADLDPAVLEKVQRLKETYGL
jgi:tellurite resistance protein